jgi:hypothetical protein
MVKNQITKHVRWMMFLVGPNSQPSDTMDASMSIFNEPCFVIVWCAKQELAGVPDCR